MKPPHGKMSSPLQLTTPGCHSQIVTGLETLGEDIADLSRPFLVAQRILQCFEVMTEGIYQLDADDVRH